MTCPVCPAVGWAGGWLGGYVGINPPQSKRGKLVSAVISGTLTLITVIALKSIFNITLCKGETFTIENILRVGIPTLAMGLVYSIGVNYLLKRLVYADKNDEAQPTQNEEDLDHDCCCGH